jgi:hypothetical protein
VAGGGVKTLPFYLEFSMLAFDSTNPYDSLGVLIADNPDALVELIRKIRTPIKIHFIVPFGQRQAAYYTGDLNARRVTSDATITSVKRPRVSKV